MVVIITMVLYKFVLEEYGVQYVEIAFGITMMPVWSVNSWDFLVMVCIIMCTVLTRYSNFKGSLAIQSNYYYYYYYYYNDPTFFTGLNCNGSEDHLFNCAINTSAPACSSTWNDANVLCPG